MEYNALAAFVGVQLDSSHDGMSESVSQISSAAISARKKMNEEFKNRHKQELENTQKTANDVQMEREKAAREYEELKRSIEDKKKGIMGMPTVSEARESYEMSVASKTSGRFTSTNPVRLS